MVRTGRALGRGAAAAAAFVFVAGLAGCGSGRASVTGRVTYQDGTPVEEGTVIGESGKGEAAVMAQGNIRPDGTFSWGTARPGDGAQPGKYRVVVVPRPLGDRELSQGMRPAVDRKYTNYDTSGIEFEVKSGRNELNITVTRPAGKEQ
jgi:hypothetical protein